MTRVFSEEPNALWEFTMASLDTQAEKYAKAACDLPEFRNLNLGGVKDKVAELLDMIGRVEGIFSTYTKHDISHINTMLKMLDWLVPPTTQAVMTPVDWLMIVLAIYLHDLGMLVTKAEYEGRMQNAEFQEFLQWLQKGSDAKDYLDRAAAIAPEEKERFFYQEFVRQHHAARIREWITGQHNRHWGEGVKPITDEIAKTMAALPPRFREHLAVVCESHHKNNLDKIEVYPLYQVYGSDEKESANVQYAALLLRTADLIHVTKDRTPSVMYKLINFSDLKSVDEWDKQMVTFAVRRKSREFDPDDEETHAIELSADFTEERPYFALTEYLAWANNEIAQTKQWADRSRLTRDGKDFWFPWREISRNIRVEGNEPRQMRFELDRGRLLNLLVGHTIYNDPTVAVRELLQNSIDAVRFRYYLDHKEVEQAHQLPLMGHVIVNWNEEKRELIVEDNGIGMDFGIIKDHLLKVGSSFYDTPQFQSDNADFTPISRFGIGVLTCFMVSDNIEIVTCREKEGRRIRMTSVHADYLLKDLSPGDPQLTGLEPHGTRVRIQLRPSVNLQERTILDIVRHWVLLPVCDVIYKGGDDESQKVGFTSTAEALRSLCFSGEMVPKSDDPYEVLTIKPYVPGGGEYELSFLVRRGFTTERSFATLEERRAIGGVSIEGIRADNQVPGFRPDFPGLLSVRRNREFRTTVSRANIERDEEYNRVSIACTEALFRHIEDEVRRISQQDGKPLSQASSAGRWLCANLQRRVSTNASSRRFRDLFRKLPLIVIEEVQTEGKAFQSSRTLRSVEDVAMMTEFWNIESRAVDYLGTISRDLGRELSVNEFLGTLAPELLDTNANPVISDAHLFKNELLQSHSVAAVEFSRRHQRTLLKWQPKEDTYHYFNPQRWSDPRFSDEIVSVLSLQGLLGFVYNDHPAESVLPHMLTQIESYTVAKVSGDIDEVHGVSTRIVTVLNMNSSIAKIWQVLNIAFMKMDPISCQARDFATLCSAMYCLALASGMASNNSYGSRLYSRSIYSPSDLVSAWRALQSDLKETLRRLEVEFTPTENIETIVGSSRHWFNAASYWLDWNGTNIAF